MISYLKACAACLKHLLALRPHTFFLSPQFALGDTHVNNPDLKGRGIRLDGR